MQEPRNKMPATLEPGAGIDIMPRNRYTLNLNESPTQNHELCSMPFGSFFAGGMHIALHWALDLGEYGSSFE